MSDETFVFQLRNPYTMMVAGPSKSGKTKFVGRVLTNAKHIYTKKPGRVFYFYNQAEPKYPEVRNHVDEFIEGMPSMKWLDEAYEEHGDNMTIVIDDQALNITKDIAEIFSVGSSRRNCNVIFITQNLFGKKKEARDISVNCNYIVIFKNPRDMNAVQTFFRQHSPTNAKALTEMYEEATEEPFSYLFIDLTQQTHSKNRYLSRIFGEKVEHEQDEKDTIEEEDFLPPILWRL